MRISKADAEEWRSVSGYEGLYEVSNIGMVRSLDKFRYNGRTYHCRVKGRILKPYLLRTHCGAYEQVTLCDERGQVKHTIHRLVATAFLDNPYSLPCVNHIDGNKLNNHVDNLEWCSFTQNNLHAYKTGLKKPYHQRIDYEEASLMLTAGKSIKEIANRFGVKYNSVYMAIRRNKIVQKGEVIQYVHVN